MAEANSSMSQSSIRRQCKVGDEDIISSLPDDVLCHILSFLPTKYAVRTSILSRRWQYTWTYVSNLHFDDMLVSNNEISLFEREKLFTKFVNRVLLLRHFNPIKSFRLRVLYSDQMTEEIKSWVFSAIIHNVENLDLAILRSTVYLPIIVFRCETLRILKLNCLVSFKIPESVWLPSLKVLLFRNIQCLEDDIIVKILYGAPVLEQLSIYRISSDQLNSLCVQSSSLKSLVIDTLPTLTQRESKGKVVIDAPNLQFLCLQDHVSKEFNVVKLSSLVKATIEVGFKYGLVRLHEGYVGQVFDILRQISNVKTLTISAAFQVLWLSNEKFPCFNNLVHLELDGTGFRWLVLSEILDCAPKLEVLILIKDVETTKPEVKFLVLCILRLTQQCAENQMFDIRFSAHVARNWMSNIRFL